jgi:hypothetical protein
MVVTCGLGFSLSASTVHKDTELRCTVNSSWDLPPPTCVPINCSLAPNCGSLLRTGCIDTMHTCGACQTGYASMVAEGDGNDQCGVLALAFNASIETTGAPPHLEEFADAVEAAASNFSSGSTTSAEIISYVQTVHQELQGLPGAPDDYMVPGPSTAWGAPALQIEDALRLMIDAPESSVTVTDVVAMSNRRRQLLDGAFVSVSYTIVSSVDVSASVSGYSNSSFLDALELTDGPISVHNSSTDLSEMGPLAVDSSSPLVSSEPTISTAVQYVLTVRVTSAPASELVLEQVSELLQNATVLGQFFDDISNRSISISRLDLLSARLVHLPLPPVPPPPPCGFFDIKCITTGVVSQYIVLSFVLVGCLWCMCGLCQAVSDKMAFKHQRKVHVEEYPSVHEAEEVLERKRVQTQEILKAMVEQVDVAQLDSLKWRVGEQAIVDHFLEMTYEECTAFKHVYVERGGKLPDIEMHLQPLEDSTIDILIEHLDELKLDTRNLHRPAPWWKATGKKHRYYMCRIYGALSSIDMVLHCLCASVLKSEGRIDDGIQRLFGLAYLSLLLRIGLSAASAFYTGWYVHEVGLEAGAHKHLTRTLLEHQRTRRRSHHERVEDARKLVSTDVATITAAARWRVKSKSRPQTAPAGQIFHDFALKTAPVPLPTIRDSDVADDQQDSVSEEGDDPDLPLPLQIAERLKGGSQRPKSAGQVSVAARAPAGGVSRARPQSAAADAMMRTPAFAAQLARRPQSAAVLQQGRPQSAGSIVGSRPGSAAPVVVSQYPPRASENTSSRYPSTSKQRPASASALLTTVPPQTVRADRPSTASGYLSPSKLLRQAAAAAMGTDQRKQLADYVPDSSSDRPQSASAALVGLQAKLITYFEETPAEVRRSAKSAGARRRQDSAGSARSRPRSSKHKRGDEKNANALTESADGSARAGAGAPDSFIAHTRPVSAPLTLFHDEPRPSVLEINVEASKHMRSIQTMAADADRKQRAARKRSQKLQDAADMGKLRMEHLKKVEQELSRQRPQSAPAEAASQSAANKGQEGSASRLRPGKLAPIVESEQQQASLKLKRPKSAAGVLMTLGQSANPGSGDNGQDRRQELRSVAEEGDDGDDDDDDEEDEDEDEDSDGEQSEEDSPDAEEGSFQPHLGLREIWQQFWRRHGLRGGLRRFAFASLCLLNPFFVAAAMCVHRKHEGPTPVPLAVVCNLWVILSDAPMAYILLDYALRRELLTVKSVFDGGGGSISSRIVAANEEGRPWLVMRVQWPAEHDEEDEISLVVYATIACTAFSLCLHLGMRWLSCMRCCCAGVSCKQCLLWLCKRCRRKPPVVSTSGQTHKARARAYMTAGTHHPLGRHDDEDEEDEEQEGPVDEQLEGPASTQLALTTLGHQSMHPSRPRSARPGSGGKHHEVNVLLERPRSATLLRSVPPPSADGEGEGDSKGKKKGKQQQQKKRPQSAATDTASSSVPHEVAEFDVVRPPRPKSAAALLPALHSLRESSHGEDVGHVNHSVW